MIKLENVTKKFDGFVALDNVSFEIQKGSAYGLLGSNGAGKSTMLRILTGVYKADGGTVSIEGESIFDNASTKQKLIFISDETAQYSTLLALASTE